MKVILAARVSTTKQDADMRMRELRQWAKVNNHLIVDEFFIYEGATGELTDRKEFMKIFNNPKGDALVLNKLDRLTRNFGSISYFEKYFREQGDKFKLIALDHTPNFNDAIGRCIFRQLLTFACLEAEQMKERQVAGIAKAKAEGKYKGRQSGALGKSKAQPVYI